MMLLNQLGIPEVCVVCGQPATSFMYDTTVTCMVQPTPKHYYCSEHTPYKFTLTNWETPPMVTKHEFHVFLDSVYISLQDLYDYSESEVASPTIKTWLKEWEEI